MTTTRDDEPLAGADEPEEPFMDALRAAGYKIENPAEVQAFLKQNRELLGPLHEAPGEIRKYFPLEGD